MTSILALIALADSNQSAVQTDAHRDMRERLAITCGGYIAFDADFIVEVKPTEVTLVSYKNEIAPGNTLTAKAKLTPSGEVEVWIKANKGPGSLATDFVPTSCLKSMFAVLDWAPTARYSLSFMKTPGKNPIDEPYVAFLEVLPSRPGFNWVYDLSATGKIVYRGGGM